MKYVSDNSLKHIADAINGNMANFSSVVQNAFVEVYENLEQLDNGIDALKQMMCECSYSPDDETLIIPQFWEVSEDVLILHGKENDNG